jgi:hypothetical protein
MQMGLGKIGDLIGALIGRQSYQINQTTRGPRFFTVGKNYRTTSHVVNSAELRTEKPPSSNTQWKV